MTRATPSLLGEADFRVLRFAGSGVKRSTDGDAKWVVRSTP